MKPIAKVNPDISVRAIFTGMALGSLLTLCNIYMGLKLGWSMNMSVIASLLGYVTWRGIEACTHCRPWTLRESNIQQTSASAAGGTVSAGLVAPIPVYLIISGKEFEYWPMVLWMICISLLGICIASTMRPLMLNNSRLRFPVGVATAEVITDIFSSGRIARQRLQALVMAMALSISHRLLLPMSCKISFGFSLPGQGVMSGTSITAKNLGFIFEPSYMLLAFGAIIGERAALSLMFGCLLAWLGIGPYILAQGWEQAGPQSESWFQYLIHWLVWPGVAMMLASALTTSAISLFRIRSRTKIPLMWGPLEYLLICLLTPVIIAIQIMLFDISWFAAALSIPLAFIFGMIASQVVGETGIPPVGALGKLSQLSFAVISPGNVTTNLMTANVAGGAAGQATDLLNDLKAGHILGTNPRHQMLAQGLGIIVGCLSSAAIFMLLIPDPSEQLMTDQWPAPGVMTWKAIALALTEGAEAIPKPARLAMLIGITAGIINELLPLLLPSRWHKYLPSMSAMGLAFVLPAQITIMLFIGAILGWILRSLAPRWSQRFLLAIAAGGIAGESIIGVFGSMWLILT